MRMVQSVFEDNLEFALSLAESAHDPADGISTEDVYHTPVTESYGPDGYYRGAGSKRIASDLTYNINNGPDSTGNFSEKLG